MSNITIAKVKPYIVIFIFVILFKGVAFIAPIGVNYTSKDISSYGLFEYALNLGQILLPLFNFGLSSSYAFFILKRQKFFIKPIYHIHFCVLIIVLLIIIAFSPNLLNNTVYISAVIGLTLSNQVFISGLLKIENRNISSVFVDTGSYILLLLIVVWYYFFQGAFSIQTWIIALLFYNIIMVAFFHLKRIYSLDKLTITDYKKVYSYGLKVMCASLLVTLLCASTRFYSKIYLTDLQVGTYSSVFRISIASFLIFRTAMIIWYKDLYRLKTSILDKRFFYSSVIALLTNLFLFITIYYRSDIFYEFKIIPHGLNEKLILLVLIQITAWISFVVFEPIFHRSDNVLKFIKILLPFVLMMTVTFHTMNHFNKLTLINLCYINTLFVNSASLICIKFFKKEGSFFMRCFYFQILLIIINLFFALN